MRALQWSMDSDATRPAVPIAPQSMVTGSSRFMAASSIEDLTTAEPGRAAASRPGGCDSDTRPAGVDAARDGRWRGFWVCNRDHHAGDASWEGPLRDPARETG